MTYKAGQKELVDRFIANAPSGVALGYPDQPFDTSQTPSIKMDIVHGEAALGSVGDPGNNLVRYPGVAMFVIRTEGGKGNVEALGYAETLMTAFRNVRITTILCKVPYIQNRLPETSQFSLMVNVPFYREAFEG